MTAVVVITKEGFKMGQKIADVLNADLYVLKKAGILHRGIIEFTNLSDTVGEMFHRYRRMVFVMSTGIVLRVIAPHIRDKYTDPAVVVVDEVGRFCISLLSGHEGGANELAYLVSSITGADPVVTTATEANRLYTCGVGFKRGESGERLLNAIKTACAEAGINTTEIRCLATAWIKRDEEAIAYASERLGLYHRYLPKWLIECYYHSHPNAPRSEFIYKKIGVYGVAEPCAMLSGRNTELILCKNYEGIKVAIARERLLITDL